MRFRDRAELGYRGMIREQRNLASNLANRLHRALLCSDELTAALNTRATCIEVGRWAILRDLIDGEDL